MDILDRLNVAPQIDVLPIDTAATQSATEAALNAGLGDIWYNLVVNPFGNGATGIQNTMYRALSAVNGAPDENGGIGRWNALQVKPFVAISGTNHETITPLVSSDLTNVIGTAPRAFAGAVIAVSDAAANARIAAAYTLLAFRQFGAKPHLDIAGQRLPFIDPPTDMFIGAFDQWNARDVAAKQGISTVSLDRSAQAYIVQDFVTGYRPQEQPNLAKSWRYVRDLFVDFNIAFNYNMLQTRRLLGKVIVSDTEIINTSHSADVIRLEVWKAEVLAFLQRMVGMAYITDLEYSKENLHVELSGTNPKRLNTQFAYKRTSVCGITSTTAYVGFSFGSEV
jgi:phage tail sheath gpL-like